MFAHVRKLFYLITLVGLFLLIAGNHAIASKGPANATSISISLVDGIAVAPNGDIYISRRAHNIVSKINKNGMLVNVAGKGTSGYSGDGGPALQAELKVPAGLCLDDQGNLYIADRENNVVRKVDTRGKITTVAGTGTAGFSGDGGPATKAQLNLPSGLAFDSKGNLYISDRSNNRIRVVDTQGNIKTFAGNGKEGYHGDNIPGLKASIDKPFGLAHDKKGNLYIADRGNNRIRKIDASGMISTVAGDGGFYFIGDNGPAYRASVAGPTGVAVDKKGNVYIADRNNNRIRMVDPLGMIRTVMGTGQRDYNGDSEVARETNLRFPFDVAVAPNGDLLVVDRSHYRIRRMNMKGDKVATVAGNGKKKFGGDGGPGTGAILNFPHGIVVDSKDNVLVADKAHYRIRKITPDGVIDTFAGTGVRGNIGDGGPRLKADIYPMLMEIDKNDVLYFNSPSGFVSLIRKIDPKGTIHLVMHTGEEEYQKSVLRASTGASAKSEITAITQFSDMAIGPDGNLYVTDRVNHQVRMVDANRKVTTIAGTGEPGYSGDGGPAKNATFRDPQSLTIDAKGNIFIADEANNVVRKIDTNGIISTYAGNGKHEDSGDGGPATKAGIRSVTDLIISPSGELYIVGVGTHVIRKVDQNGTITTVAGRSGIQGFFGDGGPATKAMLKQPSSLALDSKGNFYISDMGNNRIRKVDTQGIITTIAGTDSLAEWDREGETVEILFHSFP